MSTIPPDPRLDSGAPTGPIEKSWDKHKFDMKLVNPNNKRKFEVIVVGTGLAGASAAASLAQLGYKVKVFTFHDSPRRAHSIAAQGGINAAKNYKNDGDCDLPALLRHREGRRLPGPRGQRVPPGRGVGQHHRPVRRPGRALRPRVRRPARQPLLRRRPGEPHVLRPGPDRPAAAARRLPGARCSRCAWAPSRCYTKTEMLDVVVKDGEACGIVTRDLVTGEISSHSGHAVVLATGGYCNVFYLSTNAMNCNVTAAWRAHRKGALFANPCYTQIHPTCIPASDEFQSKLTLMSESLRNDGRIWVPEEPRRHPLARPDPRGRPRLLPRAEVPGVRQPRAPRRRLPQRQDDGRRGPRRRPAEERRVPRLRRRHRPPRRERRRASATATSSTCTSASPTRTRTRCRCASTPPSTTRWAGCGSTTTS